MGMTDTFRGTGVFNAIQFERDDKDKTEPPSTGNAPQKKETQKEKDTVPK